MILKKKSATSLFLKRNYKIAIILLKFQSSVKSFYYPQKDWGLFKTPYWKLRTKQNKTCSKSQKHQVVYKTQQNSNRTDCKGSLQDVIKLVSFFFVRIVCEDFCFVTSLWSTPAHSGSWGCYFGRCWTFFYSQIYSSLRPAGQYLLKLSEHEKATLSPEFLHPWRTQIPLSPTYADSDSRVGWLSAFSFYDACVSFSVLHKYVSEL